MNVKIDEKYINKPRKIYDPTDLKIKSNYGGNRIIHESIYWGSSTKVLF